MAPRGVVAGRERVEVEGNRITRWMIQFPSGDKCGGDQLGLGFGGVEHIRNPLGLGSVVARVGDGGAVAEMLRSMMAPPLGGAEALNWLMRTPPTANKGVTPFVRL
jgi:hypothetical protein